MTCRLLPGRATPGSYSNKSTGCYTNGWADDTERRGSTVPEPDETNPSITTNIDGRFGSSHSGGLNCCLADGSVRFISFNITFTNWNRLCINNDGNPVALDN